MEYGLPESRPFENLLSGPAAIEEEPVLRAVWGYVLSFRSFIVCCMCLFSFQFGIPSLQHELCPLLPPPIFHSFVMFSFISPVIGLSLSIAELEMLKNLAWIFNLSSWFSRSLCLGISITGGSSGGPYLADIGTGLDEVWVMMGVLSTVNTGSACSQGHLVYSDVATDAQWLKECVFYGRCNTFFSTVVQGRWIWRGAFSSARAARGAGLERL